MANPTFKHAAITRSGSEYQDLVGIEHLIKMYRDPLAYQWIELESEITEVGALDDIVVAHTNGSLELVQVKMTVDDSHYPLDWTWLTQSSGNGRSLIKKWYDGFHRARTFGTIYSASLQTNRIPDPIFASGLSRNHINYDHVPVRFQELLLEQLGDESNVRFFFTEFQFNHSRPFIDDLELTLKGILVPTDTDELGWLYFRQQVRIWSTRKSLPSPNGRITSEHLHQAITKKRARPIPQDFSIPESYQPPSVKFHDQFRARINSSPLTCLWGSPGRGKSTYLSFIVEHLLKEGHVVIRHHYHLSLTDQTPDRISFSDVAGSLIHQIRSQCGKELIGLSDDADQIQAWMQACTEHCKKNEKEFYLIVDGLDHVKREAGNIDQMSHLFNRLLPLPEHAKLIVGTQRVSDSSLPIRLIQGMRPEDWQEIPCMDADCVHAWISNQRKSNRMPLRHEPATADDELEALGKVADAFYKISNGHPLHLIYSFEDCLQKNTHFSADAVEKLPICPDGNIEIYYRGLWTRLTPESKRALHLIAGCKFQWSEIGLRQCTGVIDDVLFLLESKRTGLAAFHGSILAYVRTLPEHHSVYGALRPVVIDWLKTQAPKYLQWGWLWLLQAEEGESEALLAGVTRDWVIKSLTDGQNIDQIEYLISAAEITTFYKRDYTNTVSLRRLKNTLLNGSEYQMMDFEMFRFCSLNSLEKKHQIDFLLDSISTQPSAFIETISKLAVRRRPDALEQCVDELRRRVNLWITYKHRPWREFAELAKQFLNVYAYSTSLNPKKCVQFLNQLNNNHGMVISFVRNLADARRIDLFSEFIHIWDNDKCVNLVSHAQDAMCRLLLSEGIINTAPQRINSCKYTGLLNASLYFNDPSMCKSTLLQEITDFSQFEHSTDTNGPLESYYHRVFFYYLSEYLLKNNPKLQDDFKERSEQDWNRDVIEFLRKSAKTIADSNNRPSFSSLYVLANDIEVVAFSGQSRDDYTYYVSFQHALRNIALDLHRLQTKTSRPRQIDINDLILARESSHWKEVLWIECILDARDILFDRQALASTLKNAVQQQETLVTPFNERAERWVEITQFAQRFDLADAETYLTKAANCLIGYGYRKDLWLLEILHCIRSTHTAGYGNCALWLDRLYPICEQATEFTDGDETNYIRSEMIETLALVEPSKLPSFYSHYIRSEEHHYAEQSLTAYLDAIDLSHPVHQALVGSITELSALTRLKEIAKAGNVSADTLIKKQMATLGGLRKDRDDYHSKNTTSEDTTTVDITCFTPTEFANLVSVASDYSLGYTRLSNILTLWLNHWVEIGNGQQALDAVRQYVSSKDYLGDFDVFLDRLFEHSLKIEGKTSAYYWLILAHINRHGWQTHWSSESDVQQRLLAVRDHYPERWDDFIQDSAKLPKFLHRKEGQFALGNQYLVSLLVEVGQLELAEEITERLVSIVEQEVDDQPIPELNWLKSC